MREKRRAGAVEKGHARRRPHREKPGGTPGASPDFLDVYRALTGLRRRCYFGQLGTARGFSTSTLHFPCAYLPRPHSFMPATKSTPAKATGSSQSPILSLWSAYNDTTSTRLKTIDAFLVFLMLSGIIQFLYCILVSDFPFNAFLAGCVQSVSYS